ncbi:MAG: hypothetical protein M3N08_06655 [Pseudomonadota bacterium]|nr:hypothetical protein [Pseudomonadota bacterium]
MTDDYVQTKTQEAIAATGGNKHDAQKLLITWAVRDASLLLGMTKPHLKAIAAGLIDHAARLKSAPRTQDSSPDHFSQKAIDDMVASATGPLPKDKRTSRNIPPPKSTERQASTMRKLAAAFTKKDK